MAPRTPKTIYLVESIQAEAFLVSRLSKTIDLVESIQAEAFLVSRLSKLIDLVESIQVEAFLVSRLSKTINLVDSIQVEASWLPEPLKRCRARLVLLQGSFHIMFVRGCIRTYILRNARNKHTNISHTLTS